MKALNALDQGPLGDGAVREEEAGETCEWLTGNWQKNIFTGVKKKKERREEMTQVSVKQEMEDVRRR